MEVIKLFTVTMYIMAILGVFLLLYLRRVYSKDPKKKS